MEIAIIGAGEVVIRFIDRQGMTLLQERVAVSGPPDVRALRYVSLSIATARGSAALAPVLVSTSADQRVTFDGEDAARAAKKRCREIGCTAKVAADAARGIAPPPTPRGAAVGDIGEPEMADVLQAASASARGRRRRS